MSFRILLCGVLVALLGISPRPHIIKGEFAHARQLWQNSPASAAGSLAALAEYYPWRDDLWLSAGHLALRGDDPQAGIAYLNQAAKTQYLSAADLTTLGTAYLKTGDQSSASAAWEQSLALEPNQAIIYQQLADLHRTQSDYAALIEDLKHLAEITPGDANLTWELGMLLTAQQPGAALAYLEQAAELNPEHADSAHEIQRRIKTALLSDEPAFIYLSTGRALASQNEWEMAAEAFRQAIKLRSDYAEAWAFLGEALQYIPDPASDEDIGLPELQRALQLNPDSITANLLLSLYWQRHANFDQALSHLQHVLQLEPGNPYFHIELGNVLAKMGDLGNAQSHFEEAVQLDKNNPLFWRLLAEFALANNISLRDTALPAARQAVILAPQDAQALDVIGQIFLLLKDKTTAERFLWRAIYADPTYAPAHLHLGVVYYDQEQFKAARQQFDIAEKLAKDPRTTDEVHRLLGYYFP